MRQKASFFSGFITAIIIGWYAFPMMLYKNETQPAQFSHKVHTGDQVGLSCENCHTFTDNGHFEGIPSIEKCAECHVAQLGTTDAEKRIVEEFIAPNKEIPWRVYSRQPDNAYFPHSTHVKLAALRCEYCHGPHGESENLRPYQTNRISGYSRDIWGASISGFQDDSWEGMKMDRCVNCHAEHNRVDGCIDCHK